MAKTTKVKTAKKLMSAKEVQEEFLNMDIRRLRSFLNQYCSFKKIGNVYYYARKDVENCSAILKTATSFH